jgi:hypothetical protein
MANASTDTFRSLCAELAKTLAEHQRQLEELYHPDNPKAAWLDAAARLLDRAEVALAQSESRGPVSQELLDAWEECKSAEPDPSFPKPIVFARAILARFGHLTIKPVPISEGLPKAKDCDTRGWCWVLYGPYATWTLEPPLDSNRQPCGWSHWLPATALPLPASQEDQ